jgi:uncharacterized protein
VIFIDTGPFLARCVTRDQYHQAALLAWDRISKERPPLLTSNFVLDETFTLLGRIAGHRFAAERARAIYSSSSLEILRPGRQEELEALDLFAKFADQKVSFTDCISFALMRRRAVRRAFTFDRHFEVAGFVRWPSEG